MYICIYIEYFQWKYEYVAKWRNSIWNSCILYEYKFLKLRESKAREIVRDQGVGGMIGAQGTVTLFWKTA